MLRGPLVCVQPREERDGPSAEGATWSTGMFSTAPWFAIGKINDGPIEGYRVGPQQLYNR